MKICKIILSLTVIGNLIFTAQALEISANPISVKEFLKKLKRPSHFKKISLSENISIEEYINQYRTFLGLLPLSFNQQLKSAAQKHAQYLAANPDYKNLDSHYEDPSRPKFFAVDASERCEKEGFSGICRDLIAWDYPSFQKSIDEWMKSPFHRMPVITRSYGQIGCDQADKWYVCNIALEDELIPLPELTFPAHGQMIEGSFKVNEFPEPYPGYSKKVIGPTLMFWPKEEIQSIQMGLLNFRSKKPIELMFIPNNLSAFTYGAVVANPKDSLPRNTIFVAMVKGIYESGESFQKKWVFKAE